MKPIHFGPLNRGFTLVELLVVTGIITILVIIHLPALAKAKLESQGIYCLNNQKQLALAAIVYSQEFQDNWVPNMPGQTPGWVSGFTDFNASNTDNTNLAKLVNRTLSVMGPYVLDPRIYHCPADPSFVLGEGARVRSVSMNGAVGTVPYSLGALTAGSPVNGQWLLGYNIGLNKQSPPTWRTYGKTSAMNIPGPAMLWVFMDEHPYSINDGAFAVQMSFTGPNGTIIDFPASYHNGACGISFADGHAEFHRWIGNTIKLPVGIYTVHNASGTTAGDSAADLQWLQAHTSAHF